MTGQKLLALGCRKNNMPWELREKSTFKLHSGGVLIFVAENIRHARGTEEEFIE